MWRYLELANFDGAPYQKLKRRYARELSRHLNLKISTNLTSHSLPGPAIYVSNHISYLDIPLVMNIVSDACFVSKSEIAMWPVIGQAARRIETVFVKREKKSSREGARKALAKVLSEEKKKIIVFPSGTTSIHKTEFWRKGVFEIAHQHHIPVIPIRLNYEPLREIAYIDDDNFMAHLLRLVAHERLDVHIEFGEMQKITNPLADCHRIKEWCEAHMDIQQGSPLLTNPQQKVEVLLT